MRAFRAEKYSQVKFTLYVVGWRLSVSQIPEFIIFEERLENSLQRDIVKIEHLRMRITHEPITSDLVDMELIELKFIFGRCKFITF